MKWNMYLHVQTMLQCAITQIRLSGFCFLLQNIFSKDSHTKTAAQKEVAT